MNNEHIENAKVFKALCDEKRLQILELLRDGEKCACVLTDLTGIKQTALSYHMKILCESNLVKGIQDGKWVNYSLNEEGREEVKELLIKLTTLNSEQTPNSCYLDKLENSSAK